MERFGRRLAAARRRADWTQAELARRADVPKQSIQAIESSDQRSSKYLPRLAKALGVSEGWLLGVQDTPRRGADGVTQVAVRGLVAAGLWIEDDRQIAEDTPVPASPNPTYSGRPQIAFRVAGTSMDRLVHDGEYAICVDFAESPIHLRDGDIVVAERRRGGACERTIKRVRLGARGAELWPDSTDPEHQSPIPLAPEDETESEVTVIGFVIGAYRPLP